MKIEVIPDEQLTPTQLHNLEIARIVSEVPVHAAMLVDDRGDTHRIIGAYKVQTKEMFISIVRLNHLRTTINTDVHEEAHHESQANDGTRAHEHAVRAVGARVATLAAKGELDKYLVGAVW